MRNFFGLCNLFWFKALFILSVSAIAEEFVGSAACASCHVEQFQSWKKSHHAKAMNPATDAYVLGDFSGRRFTYAGKTSIFYKKQNSYWVKTEGPNGNLQDYQVSFTLGFEPLQQYVIAFPNGHYQVLSVAWDNRSIAEGGQRWFHLYSEERIDYKDPLHWTGPYQKWNSQCAACHVTNWKKEYQWQAGAYNSSWSETGIGCEACHGPGEIHIQAANNGFPNKELHMLMGENLAGDWWFRDSKPIATIQKANTKHKMNACLGCHSRRDFIAEHSPEKPWLESYTPAFIDERLYHADGQILDEVFVGGSFLQSAMHAAGVTCGNCHDPHSGGLLGGEGKNSQQAVCLQCHQASEYDSNKHHHHEEKSSGAQCVNCHMPHTVYMQVDARRDHSIRIPDPKLTLTTGSPNACNQCHQEETPSWANSVIEHWQSERTSKVKTRGVSVYRNFAYGNKNDKELPGILTATLLANSPVQSEQEFAALVKALENPDPLVRLGAVRGFNVVPVEYRKEYLWPLLKDRNKGVRLETFGLLSAVPATVFNQSEKHSFQQSREEFVHAQLLESDRASAWLRLGEVYLNLGEMNEAEKAFLQAEKIEPYLSAVLLNLAELYRIVNKPRESERWLKTALTRSPNDAGAHHAYAMWLVREKRYEESLVSLKSANELAPQNGQIAYAYMVALVELEKFTEAQELAQRVNIKTDYGRQTILVLRAAYLQRGMLHDLERLEKLISK